MKYSCWLSIIWRIYCDTREEKWSYALRSFFLNWCLNFLFLFTDVLPEVCFSLKQIFLWLHQRNLLNTALVLCLTAFLTFCLVDFRGDKICNKKVFFFLFVSFNLSEVSQVCVVGCASLYGRVTWVTRVRLTKHIRKGLLFHAQALPVSWFRRFFILSNLC